MHLFRLDASLAFHVAAPSHFAFAGTVHRTDLRGVTAPAAYAVAVVVLVAQSPLRAEGVPCPLAVLRRTFEVHQFVVARVVGKVVARSQNGGVSRRAVTFRGRLVFGGRRRAPRVLFGYLRSVASRPFQFHQLGLATCAVDAAHLRGATSR